MLQQKQATPETLQEGDMSIIERAKMARGGSHRTNRVIILFTQVRIVADRIGSTYVLKYQRIASHAFRACFASAPHTCSLNGGFPDTVGYNPHICKGNRDEDCTGQGEEGTHADPH